MIFWFLMAVLIVGADQLLKFVVSSQMLKHESLTLIPDILNITYVENKGAAFSILSDYTWVLSILSVVFCIAIFLYILIKKPKNKLLMVSLIMIFAGALGNAIDRVFLGYVIDFIEVRFIDFPIFNLADISITVGAGILMVYEIFFDREKKDE